MSTPSRPGRIIVALTFITVLMPAAEVSALTSFHLWSRSGAGVGLTDNARAVAVDAAGNVFVTGTFSDTFGMGGSPLSSNGFNDMFLAKYDANGTHQWSQSFGGNGIGDTGYALATDAAGNVYLTGGFRGAVDFGGTLLTSSGGSIDIVLAKYNTSGTLQWASRFGSTGIDEGFGIAIDGMSNVYMTGRFNGTVSFNGLPGGLPSTGADDIFIAKYNSNGIAQFATTFGSTASDWGQDIVVDGFGNIVIAGLFNGTISNMGGPTLTPVGGTDAFLAKFDSGATLLWNKAFGSTGLDQGFSVATDASANVFFAGTFSGSVNFGGGALNSSGDTDAVLAKYDGAGVHQWSKRFGGMLADGAHSVGVDGSGSPVIGGFFRSIANFGGGNHTSAGGVDGFVAKFRANGAPAWSRGLGGTAADVAYGVATGPTGSAHVTGGFTGTVNLGGSNLTSANNSEDVFLAKYAADSIEPVISSITDIGNDQGRQVTITFARSAHDDPVSATPVIRYEAYRRIKAAPAASAAVDPARLSPRDLMIQGWTEVGTVDGHGEGEYSIDAPTIGDSTVALGQYRSIFFIRGATGNSFAFFDSPPDSGYSLDNLAPGVPSSLVFTSGDLAWDESSAADFDYFTVYGSNTDSFGAATVVDYTVAPEMDVNASPYVFYFVTATDFSGNEGKPAKVNTLSGVGGTPRSYVLSVSNYPNPFNPGTTVSYTVPSRGRVSVGVFDTRGALVATLFEGERSAGAYSVEWDGRTGNAAVAASGIYFARISHNGATHTKKMVLLK